MDGRLIVLNRNAAGISNFRVYSLVSDIQSNLTVATLEHTYQYSNLGYSEKENFVVSGFEVAPTDDLKERKLFLGMKHTNVTFVNIISATYNLRLLLPS